MKRQFRVLGIALSCFLLAACMTATQAQQAPAQQSLYQRLGGYDAIAAVTDDFIVRLNGDARFARLLVGLSGDSKKRLRQHVVEQLCEATGGPCFYMGRTMLSSHAGLGITEQEWDVAAGFLSATLDKFKVPAREKGEVLAFVTGLKADIVDKK